MNKQFLKLPFKNKTLSASEMRQVCWFEQIQILSTS